MERTKWFEPRRAVAVLVVTVLWAGSMGTQKLQGQFRGLVVAGACAGGAVIGERLGAKVADYHAKRMKVPPEQAQKQKLAFRIGFALALCGGGAVIANTTYSRLSKRGVQARQKEVMNALDDAAPMTPHSYTDPEDSSLNGVAKAQPMYVDGERECRVVEDQLGTDQSLVTYCRKPGEEWKLKKL